MTLEITVNEIYQKIGRNLVLCQQLERLLKSSNARSSNAGFVEDFKNTVIKNTENIEKQTMGQLAGQYLENYYSETHRPAKKSPNTEKPFIALDIFTDNSRNNSQKIGITLAEIVQERNNLVHHLLSEFDPTSLTSRQYVGEILDKQKYKLEAEIRRIQNQLNHTQQILKELHNHIQSGELKKQLEVFSLIHDISICLHQITLEFARSDGWTVMNQAGQQLRQRVPEQLALLKSDYGYRSLKSIIIISNRFELYEEVTKKGTRLLYRTKSEFSNSNFEFEFEFTFKPI